MIVVFPDHTHLLFFLESNSKFPMYVPLLKVNRLNGLTLCMLGNFSCVFKSSADISKLAFSNNYFRNTIRESNNLDPDQDRHCVGPDLGPNCFQRLSAVDKSCLLKGKSYR